MTDQVFFVVYPGELTADDRAALDRPGFKVYENGIGMSEPFWQGEGAQSGFTTYQVVRLAAANAVDARQQVIDAIGRKPEGLRAQRGQSR